MIDIENAIDRIEKQLVEDEFFHLEVGLRKSGLKYTMSIWIPNSHQQDEYDSPRVLISNENLDSAIGKSLDDLAAIRQSDKWRHEGLCSQCGDKFNADGICVECGNDDLPF
jgi:hypothetical protein